MTQLLIKSHNFSWLKYFFSNWNIFRAWTMLSQLYGTLFKGQFSRIVGLKYLVWMVLSNENVRKSSIQNVMLFQNIISRYHLSLPEQKGAFCGGKSIHRRNHFKIFVHPIFSKIRQFINRNNLIFQNIYFFLFILNTMGS